jgi:hypothetical protein
VLSLGFSKDGRLLYSGGEEYVLVVWDLIDYSKSFLPRLNANLVHLITFQQNIENNQRVLISTLDNVIRLVNVAK